LFLYWTIFTPNKDINSAQHCKGLREFAREQQLTHFYEGGDCGVEHALLPERGIVQPGDLVIGADSHTCTYGALGPSPPVWAARTWLRHAYR
jgi:3-isopropylmalate/(R)-2-methylmalate dehydratase large subunit